jgi:hypothetical protein
VDQIRLDLGRLFSFTAALFLGLSGASRAAEDESRILATSPSGNLRVEQKGEDFWIVSTKAVAQKVNAKYLDLLSIILFSALTGHFASHNAQLEYDRESREIPRQEPPEETKSEL